jgi:hypothetical protein
VGAIGKILIGIVGLIFTIFLLAIIVPAQFQQQQATNSLIKQDVSQVNDASVNLINICVTDQSVGDLTMCKSSITDLKNKCQGSQYSSMSVCTDPRIDQFLSTVDSKTTYAEGVISNSASKVVDSCVSLIASEGNNQECISEMQNIQQSCNQYNIGNHMTVCSDPRINEILSGSISSQLPNMALPNFNQTNQNSSNIIQSANQYTLSFIDSCMKATDSSVIQTCSETAKKMLDYCNNISSAGIGQICNDPRLAQLANVGQTANSMPLSNPSQTTINATAFNYINNEMQSILNQCANNVISNSASCISAMNTVKQNCNSMLEKNYPSYFPVCNDPRLAQLANVGQTSNPISSSSSSCPTSSTYDVTIIKNSLGNSLFNPYILNLQGDDYVIFQSSDGKPHLLTSNNENLKNWFLTNGALINNDQTIKLPIMIFGDTEKFLGVYDGYNPNIYITLDVKPTPIECSK